ncbi:DUF5801 repeats-in-toxin domain-containing protein [Dongia sp.]|uniref:T1SS-143 repeat domain-containing protein n=1 Tax=Dongia sp. TaxID=1977262 RepID=UPI0035AEC24A
MSPIFPVAHNNGGVFTPFDPNAGIGGLNAVGGLNPTGLNYNLVEREFPELIEEDEIDTVPTLLNISKGAVINEDDLGGDFNEVSALRASPADDPTYASQIAGEVQTLLGVDGAWTGHYYETGNDPFDLDDNEEGSQNGNDPANEDNGNGVDIDREPLTSTAVVTVDFHIDIPGKISFQNGADIPLKTQLEGMGLTSHGNELQYVLLPAVADDPMTPGDESHGEILVAYYIQANPESESSEAVIVFTIGVREPQGNTQVSEFDIDFTIFGVIDNVPGTNDADGDISDILDIDVPFFMVDSDGSVTPSPADALVFQSVDDVPELGSIGDNGEEGGYQLVLKPADTNITHDETEGEQSDVGAQAGDPDSAKEISEPDPAGDNGEDDVSVAQNEGVHKALAAAGLGEVTPLGAAQTELKVSFGADGPASGNKEAGNTVFTGDGGANATAFQLYIGDADAPLVAGATNWTVTIDGIEVTVRAEQIDGNTIVGYANKGDVDGDGVLDNQQGGDAVQAAVPDADVPVFVLHLDPDSGQLTLVQLHQINQGDPTNADDSTPPLAILGQEIVFEDNFDNLDSWTVLDGGEASIVGDIGTTDTQPDPNSQALLTPSEGGEGDEESSQGASSADIEAFFGLPAGSLDGAADDGDSGNGSEEATNGSAIKQVVDVVAGQVLTVKFNFLEDENDGGDGTTYQDFGFIVIGDQVIRLSNVEDADLDSNASSGNFSWEEESGYLVFTYTFTNTESVQIGFGVMNEDDEAVDPGLLIDHLTITQPGAELAEINFRATDFDGDHVDAALNVRVQDDGPTVSCNKLVQLDDDALTGGNDGGIGDDADAANVTGTLSHDYGTDGAGTTLLTGAVLPDGFTSALSNGGKTLIISQNGVEVIKVTLDDSSSGKYTVAQLNPIDHPEGDNENNLDFTVNYQVKDVDGDAVNGTLSINVDDDTPKITGVTYDTEHLGIVDEDKLPDGIEGGPLDIGNFDASVGGKILVQPGADQPVTFSFAETSGTPVNVIGAAIPPLFALTDVDGNPVTMVVDNAGSPATLIGMADGEAVFTITLDKSTGEFTFTLHQPVEHPYDGSPFVSSLEDSLLTLGFGVKVTDADGDSASSQLYFKINDDSPEVSGITGTNGTPSSDGYLLVDEDYIAGGNQDQGSAGNDASGGNVATGKINFGFGADGGTISLADSGNLRDAYGNLVKTSDGNATISLVNTGNVITGYEAGTGTVVFTLTLNQDGTFTYTQFQALKHADTASSDENSSDIRLKFDVKIVDNDGDEVSTTIKIRVDDDMPRVTSATVIGIVEEEALTLANSGGHAQGNQEAGDAEPDTTIASGSLTSLVSIGADTPGNWYFSHNVSGLNAQNLTSGGVALQYSWNGEVLEAKAAGVLVFTLSLNANGGYTFTLLDHIDHADGNGENSRDIDFSSLVRVSDSDGDNIGIASGAFKITVVDDVPIANDDHQFMKESQHTITGNVLTGDTNDPDTATDQPAQQDQVGADDPGRVSEVQSLSNAGGVVNIDTGDKGLDNDTVVVQGKYGKLTINENGDYSYDLDPGFDIDTLTADPVHVGRPGTGGQAADWVAQGLTITATKFDGSAGTVQYDSNGIGVAGTKPGLQVPGQIGYDPNSQTSEKLTMAFGCPVNSATVKVSNLFKDENDGEQGTWTAYDANGNVIGHGIFGPGADNPATGYIHVNYGNSNNIGTLEIGVDDTNGVSIARIEFGATEYGPNNNAGNLSTDSSDYYIREVTYVPAVVQEQFEYTLTDKDGDSDKAILTIDVCDNVPSPRAGNAAGLVTEDVLAGGSGEDPASAPASAIFNGTLPIYNGTVSNLTFDDPNSSLDGAPVKTEDANTITLTVAGEWTMVIVKATGAFTFTLLDDQQHGDATKVFADDTLLGKFIATISGSGGPDATGTISISVNDDGPVARVDTDNVANLQSTTGNVITGLDTDGGLGGTGADTKGADGAAIAGVRQNPAYGNSFDNDGSNGFTVTGQYGTLTMGTDGTYTYTRYGNGPLEAVDHFEYTLKDGDGDLSIATLDITISDKGVTLDVPVAGEAGTKVYEAGLPAGSTETADGIPNNDNSEKTVGTVTFSAPDGLGSLTIKGVPVVVGADIPGAYGTLHIDGIDVVTGVLTYTYTLNGNTSGDATHDDFEVIVTDSDNDSTALTLVVDIVDDVPTARDDADSAGNHISAAGNVITGIGTTDPIAGADTKGADGATVSGATGFNGSADSDPAGGFVVNGQYGQLFLQANGEYLYIRSGTGPLEAVDHFTYTLTDADGDSSVAKLDITINDKGVTLDVPTTGEAGTKVYEAGLPAGSTETADGIPNNDNSEKTSGTVTFTTPDGFGTLMIKGVSVAPGVDIAGTYGTLHIDSVNLATGTLTYTYTLTTNTAGDTTHDDFSVLVVDNDGDSTSLTLTVDIVDDVPTARDDADSVAEGLGNQATGNVITGLDTTNPSAGADTKGADGAAVSGVSGPNGSDNDATGGFTVTGLYGTLTMQSNGSYIYTLTAASVPAGAKETFTYTLTDGDNDSDPATLTIAIDQDTRIPTVTNSSVYVDEEGLPDGTLAPTDAEIGASNFFVDTHGEGLSALTIGGAAVNLGAPYPQTIINDSQGALVVMAVIPSGGGYIVHYNYILADNVLTHSVQGKDDMVAGPTFAVVATDATGDSNVSGSVQVVIGDDAPIGNNDVDGTLNQLSTDGNVITGAGTFTGVSGADKPGADGGSIVGVSSIGNPSAAVPVSADPTHGAGLSIQGVHGTLVIYADGYYVYTRANGDPVHDGVDTFLYTLKDGDGDIATPALIIHIDDAGITVSVPPAGSAGALVDEKGLPDGSGEVADPTLNSDQSEVTSGQITITAPDGLASVTIGGTTLTLAQLNDLSTFPVTIGTTGHVGTLVLTGFAGNKIAYTYTLTDNTSGDNTHDDFAVAVTDSDGDTGNTTLSIKVVDDVPMAADDSFGSVEHSVQPVYLGNVLTNDTYGADGGGAPQITDISWSGWTTASDGAGGWTMTSGAGTIHVAANGDVTYTGVPGFILGTPSFYYTIKDGDGDFSSAKATFSVYPDPAGGTTAGSVAVDEDSKPNQFDSDPANDAAVAKAIAINFTPVGDTVPNSVTIKDLPNGVVLTYKLGGVGAEQTFTGDGSADLDISWAEAQTLKLTQPNNDIGTDYAIGYTVHATDTSSGETGNIDGGIAVVVNAVGDYPSALNAAFGGIGIQGQNVVLTVNGSFGDVSDGSEAHYLLVKLPDGSWDGFGDGHAAVPLADGNAYGVPAGTYLVINVDSQLAAGDNDATAQVNIAVPGNAAGSQSFPVYAVAIDSEIGEGANSPSEIAGDDLAVRAGDATLEVAGKPSFSLATVKLDEDGLAGGGQPGTGDEDQDAGDSGDGLLDPAGPRGTEAVWQQTILADWNGSVGVFNISTGQQSGAFLQDGNGNFVLTADGHKIVMAASGDASGTTLTGYPEGGSPADPALTISITHEGVLTVNLHKPLQHADGGAENNLTFPIVVHAENAAGTTSETVLVNIDDDMPTVTPLPSGFGLGVQEALFGVGGGTDVSGLFAPVDFGADGAAAVGSVTYKLTDAGGNAVVDGTHTGIYDSASGQEVLLYNDGAGGIVGRTEISGLSVFTVSVGGSSVYFSQQRPIVHGDTSQAHENKSILDEVLHVTQTVTDADGDKVSATHPNAVDLWIYDDGPKAVLDSGGVNEGALLTVSAANGVLQNDSAGADGFDAGGGVVGVRAAGVDTTTPVATGVGTQISGLYGKLTLQADGSYTYKSNPDAIGGNASDVFVYTIKDKDGDTATTTLTINLTDSGLIAPDDNDVLVHESALDKVKDGTDLVAGTVIGSLGEDSPLETDNANQLDGSGGFGALTYSLVGSANGTYGTIQINSDGSYTYTLTKNYDSQPGSDDGFNTEENKDHFTYLVTDANGNTATGTITVDIVDDVPTVTFAGASAPDQHQGAGAAPGYMPIDEDWLAGGGNDATASTGDTLGDKWVLQTYKVGGADGLADAVLSGISADGAMGDALRRSSDGAKVLFVTSADGKTITGYADADNSGTIETGEKTLANKVVEATVSTWGVFADVKLEVFQALQHDSTPASVNSGDGNIESNINLHVTLQVTDGDGDKTSIVSNFQVNDDLPSAADEALQNVAEGATKIGNFDFVAGADGATVTHVGGTALVFGGDGWSQSIDIGHGTIKVKADGSYSFTADASVIGPGAASSTFTITDRDGDSVTKSVSFAITDANLPTGGSANAAVDDDGLTGGNAASTSGDLAVDNSGINNDNNEATFKGTLTHTIGGDGYGSVTFATLHNTSGTVGTETVTYSWDAGTNTLTATGPRGILFDIVVTPATGAYTLTLRDNVLHADGGNENDALVALTYTVKDADNSTATGTLNITFDDDAPTAYDDAFGTKDAVIATAVSLGNLFANNGSGADRSGADGYAASGAISAVTAVQGGGTVASDGAGGWNITIAGKGVAHVEADGDVTFTASAGNTISNLGENFSFTYTVKDADGDTSTATATYTMKGSVPDSFVVGENVSDTPSTQGTPTTTDDHRIDDSPNAPDGSIDGAGGNDLLIGDVGGKTTIITPGQDYSIMLICDTSGSMTTNDRIGLLRDALTNLVNQLVDFEGHVNIAIVDFDGDATLTFQLDDIGNATQQQIDELLAEIAGLEADGATNYQDAFLEVKPWFDTQDASYPTYEKVAYFLTDGDPTSNNETGGGSSVNPVDMYYGNQAFNALLAAHPDLQVYGIGIGSGVTVGNLQYFDNTDVTGQQTYVDDDDFDGGNFSFTDDVGDPTIVNTAEELAAALQGGSSSTTVQPVGNDIVNGAGGNDVMLGDSIYFGSADAGWAAFKAANPGLTDAQLKALILANIDAFAQEGTVGGNDTMNGGAGNDIIFGQGGHDDITGGTGTDRLVGGTGNDTYRFAAGDGNDTIEEAKGSADTVVITDANGPAPTLAKVGNDLVITYNGGETITVVGHFLNYVDATNNQQIEFVNYNGTVYAIGGGNSPVLLLTATTNITAISTDSGTAGDFITNDTTLTVSGTNTALAAGQKVQISLDGTNWFDVVQDTGTTWHYADGVTHAADFTYQSRVIDTNGIAGAADSQLIDIDTAAPTATLNIAAISNDSGTGGDFITNDTSLTVSGTNSALGSGDKIQISLDGTNWVDVTQSTATTWTYNDPATHNSSFSYQVRVVDGAGNVGNTDTQAITIDTTAPTATLNIASISNDSGTAGDFITNDTVLTVSGINSALGTGEKIQISFDGATWTDVTQSTSTTWTYNDPATHNSSFSYLVRVVDAAGNVGNTDTQVITIDTTAPTAVGETVRVNDGTIDLPEWLLLLNDTNGAVDVANVSGGSDGSAVHTAGENGTGKVIFTDNDTDGGSFTYQAVDAVGNATGNVTATVTRDNTGAIDGTIGADLIFGYTGNDTLQGQNGNDTYAFRASGDGADTITDSNGTDKIVIGTMGAALTSLSLANNGSNDLVIGYGSESITIVDHYASNGAVETLTFQGGSSYLGYLLESYTLGTDQSSTFRGTDGTNDMVAGTSAGNTLDGGDSGGTGGGNDILAGNAGNDTLNGGDGNDLLMGGADVDTLNGGSGNDLLVGGSGADVLHGDAGKDTLIYDLADTVIDGGSDTDRLVFAFDAAVDSVFTGKMTSIEVIDMTNGATDHLGTGDAVGASSVGRVSAQDVLDITDSAGGHLYIVGDATDQLRLSATDGWSSVGNTNVVNASSGDNIPDGTYVHYISSNGTHLYVDQDVTVVTS